MATSSLSSSCRIIAKDRTRLHPCSVEYINLGWTTSSPLQNNSSSFLCGQYELNEQPQTVPDNDEIDSSSSSSLTRSGCVDICSYDNSRSGVSAERQGLDPSPPPLGIIARRPHALPSGLLDMKVAGDVVATAASDGILIIHRAVRSADGMYSLSDVVSASAKDQGLFLSVDWSVGYDRIPVTSATAKNNSSSSNNSNNNNNNNNRRMTKRTIVRRSQPQNMSQLAVSTQQGSIILYKFAFSPVRAEDVKEEEEIETSSSSSWNLTELSRFECAHTISGQPVPAWIVCFDPHSKQTLVSGGDDCCMKLWDIRSGGFSREIHTDKSSHQAGMTSAQWHPTEEHLFATGSYDEHVRVWDHRALKAPLLELHAGGGVWRVKWNLCDVDDGSSLLFLACMQGGCTVAEYQAASGTISLSHQFPLEQPPPRPAPQPQQVPRCPEQEPEVEQLQQEQEQQEQEHEQEQVGPQKSIQARRFREKPLLIPVCKHTSENDQHLAYGIELLDAQFHNDDDVGCCFCQLTVASCSFYDNLVEVWQGDVV